MKLYQGTISLGSMPPPHINSLIRGVMAQVENIDEVVSELNEGSVNHGSAYVLTVMVQSLEAVATLALLCSNSARLSVLKGRESNW